MILTGVIQIADAFAALSTSFRLPIDDCQLSIADCRLPGEEPQALTASCLWPIASRLATSVPFRNRTAQSFLPLTVYNTITYQ
jgi:hypothetical protein